MSGFDAEWLSLRERADRRARSVPLAAVLARWLAPRGASILDLGCGTGASVRFLAPLIGTPATGGAQRWICVDDDPALLQLLQRTVLEGVTIEARRIDLARDLAEVDAMGLQAFVASALLDLVSAPWLAALVALARRADAAVLFALSYDGRLDLEPAHAADDAVRAAFNAHQRRDKGFGPALGPRACEAVATALREAGYDVRREASDWRLQANDSDDAALMAPLAAGIARAAAEQSPRDASRIGAWLALRQEQIGAGSLRVTVGHEDVLGLPPAGGASSAQ